MVDVGEEKLGTGSGYRYTDKRQGRFDWEWLLSGGGGARIAGATERFEHIWGVLYCSSGIFPQRSLCITA